ncbi:MAG: hypothetical protein HC771_16340 [Synechococcales cyanobacterium CRU_2_2]|nr:hypothetical protein [Synechococcales cyanobacterium CRU_2_2]
MQKLIITGIVGVLIGATAFSTKPSISQSPAPKPSPTTEPAAKSRRLTIAVSVSAMSDLKVSEGQTLQTGDTIADRTPERQRLETQKVQLTLSLARLQSATLPAPAPPADTPTIAALPNPSFLEAQAQVEKSKADVDSTSATISNKKAEIDYLGTLPNLNPMTSGRSETIVLDHERAKLAELEQQHTATVRDYQLAMGKLSTAQENRAHQEYQHSLNQAERTEARNRDGLEYQRQIADFAEQHRDRDFQISQIQLKLNEIDNQLATLAAVRAPQPGKIRRIKWLGQAADGRLNAQLTFIPDRPGRAATLPEQPAPMPQPTEPSRDRPQSGDEDD